MGDLFPRRPALLSTVVHGRDARCVVPIAEATLEALEMRGDLDRGRLWIDLMLAALAPSAAAALEAAMTETSGYISETFRRLAAGAEARGGARGEARTMRDALRRVLRVRGLTLSPTEERRLEACEDPEELSRWLDRAEVVDRTADLFVDER